MARGLQLLCLCIIVRTTAFAELRVRVLEGDAAINSIRLHRAFDPVVQVTSDGEPVKGASVVFLLPSSGAGGTFSDNEASLTVQTDEKGVATAKGLRPNRIPGQFEIRVAASWRGQRADAALTQTNTEPESSAGRKRITLLAIIGGAAAAGGVIAATHAGGSSSPPAAATGSTTSGSTISAGTPVIGPPH